MKTQIIYSSISNRYKILEEKSCVLNSVYLNFLRKWQSLFQIDFPSVDVFFWNEWINLNGKIDDNSETTKQTFDTRKVLWFAERFLHRLEKNEKIIWKSNCVWNRSLYKCITEISLKITYFIQIRNRIQYLWMFDQYEIIEDK